MNLYYNHNGVPFLLLKRRLSKLTDKEEGENASVCEPNERMKMNFHGADLNPWPIGASTKI
jgi:hypothetical protein